MINFIIYLLRSGTRNQDTRKSDIHVPSANGVDGLMHPNGDRTEFMLKFKIAANTLNAHDHKGRTRYQDLIPI